MKKPRTKKMAKAGLVRGAASAREAERRLLARSLRTEKRIVALSKRLRTALGRRDRELQELRDTIDVYRGVEPEPHVTAGRDRRNRLQFDDPPFAPETSETKESEQTHESALT